MKEWNKHARVILLMKRTEIRRDRERSCVSFININQPII